MPLCMKWTQNKTKTGQWRPLRANPLLLIALCITLFMNNPIVNLNPDVFLYFKGFVVTLHLFGLQFKALQLQP